MSCDLCIRAEQPVELVALRSRSGNLLQLALCSYCQLLRGVRSARC